MKAMEFAITGPARCAGSDDSWLPGGARGFLLARRRSEKRSGFANHADCGVWGDWNAGALRAAGARADTCREYVSVWDAAGQFERMFFAGIDRAIHAESSGDFTGLARGHRRGIFWRVHYVFEFWLGDRENAGRRRVGEGNDVRRRERVSGTAAFSGRDSIGEPVLGW